MYVGLGSVLSTTTPCHASQVVGCRSASHPYVDIRTLTRSVCKPKYDYYVACEGPAIRRPQIGPLMYPEMPVALSLRKCPTLGVRASATVSPR